MNAPKKIRIYGKEVKRWTTWEERNGRQFETLQQIELKYKEIDATTGTITGTGSEDFSRDRYEAALIRVHVWTWDGKRRNKGGYKWHDYQGAETIRKEDTKPYKEYIKNKYHAASVDLRK